jgi:hypothetical protein
MLSFNWPTGQSPLVLLPARMALTTRASPTVALRRALNALNEA